MSEESRSWPRMLVIDDSDLVHRLLRARLKHERIELKSAIGGEEGGRAGGEGGRRGAEARRRGGGGAARGPRGAGA